MRIRIRIHNTEVESQEKLGVWDHMPELTITRHVHSRVDSNTFTMGNHMPGSTLSPSQGIWIWPLLSMLDQRCENDVKTEKAFRFLVALVQVAG